MIDEEEAKENALEALVGRTITQTERSFDYGDDVALRLYLDDGSVFKMEAYWSSESITWEIKEPETPRKLEQGEDEALAKLFSHTEEL